MRRVHVREGGFTLVEMIIVLGMFAVVAAVVAVTIAHSAQLSTTATARADDTFSATDAAGHIAERVRSGSIVAAGTNVLVVDVDETGRCVRSTYTVVRDSAGDPVRVDESVRTIATGDTGRCVDIDPGAWDAQGIDLGRVLVDGLRAPDSGEPVWALYSRGNAVLDATSTDAAVFADPCAIARVDVTLSAGEDDSTAVVARSSAAVGARTWGLAC